VPHSKATHLIDSDILSLSMRSQEPAFSRVKNYFVTNEKLSFSAMTRFEVLRGLLAKNATTQTKKFELLCVSNDVISIDLPILDRAAYIYAYLFQQGKLIADGDLIIAATAIEHNLILATRNVKHFERIPGLQLENWMI
jgi:tRNA(fMet)-specific endonuclease VapC